MAAAAALAPADAQAVQASLDLDAPVFSDRRPAFAATTTAAAAAAAAAGAARDAAATASAGAAAAACGLAEAEEADNVFGAAAMRMLETDGKKASAGEAGGSSESDSVNDVLDDGSEVTRNNTPTLFLFA